MTGARSLWRMLTRGKSRVNKELLGKEMSNL